LHNFFIRSQKWLVSILVLLAEQSLIERAEARGGVRRFPDPKGEIWKPDAKLHQGHEKQGRIDATNFFLRAP
jgi:hypothetical protein